MWKIGVQGNEAFAPYPIIEAELSREFITVNSNKCEFMSKYGNYT